MKLPSYKRISREDLKDSPDWVGNLLYPINQFFETVYNTLNGQVTYSDNFLSFQKILQFTTDSAYSGGTWDVIQFAIPDSFRNKVSGVLILSLRPEDSTLVKGSSPTSLVWSENNRSISLDWIAGLSNSKIYNITVLVI